MSRSPVAPAGIVTMRNIAVIGGCPADLGAYDFPVQKVSIEGLPVTVGIVRTPVPSFDPDDASLTNKVLVRKLAISLNFRDKRGILLAATRGHDRGYLVVGSEFVGEIAALGPGVTGFQIGSRVIGDNSFPKQHPNGAHQGLTTAQAGREYQVLDARKLIEIPYSMPIEVAAGFSVGAQTSYAMLRRLQIEEGSSVLVTAPGSNTSLFTIAALRKYGADVYALSRNKLLEERVLDLGAKELIVVDPAKETLRENERIRQLVSEKGGFNYAIDPFCDIYCRNILDILAMSGKYVTCGYYNQYRDITATGNPIRSLEIPSFTDLVVRNLQIIGNCLGSTEDLQAALSDYAEGQYPIVIDSVFRGNDVGAFLSRTFADPKRFGRVIYRFDEH